jgi:hypothetical protein
LIKYEIKEVVVDDFTGQDIIGGWGLTRLSDGATWHFSSLVEGSIDAFSSFVGAESAYRMFVAALEKRLQSELAEVVHDELLSDQESALLIAQQADEIADETSASLLEEQAKTLSPGDEQAPRFPNGTRVLVDSTLEALWCNGKYGTVTSYREGAEYDYEVQLDGYDFSTPVYERELFAI